MKNFFILLTVIGICFISNFFKWLKTNLPFKQINLFFWSSFLITTIICSTILLIVYKKIDNKK